LPETSSEKSALRGDAVQLERSISPIHAELESANSGSHPDTREAPRRGGWGGGSPLIADRHWRVNTLFALFIEQAMTNLDESAMSIPGYPLQEYRFDRETYTYGSKADTSQC
jgi:hypothetical protein